MRCADLPMQRCYSQKSEIRGALPYGAGGSVAEAIRGSAGDRAATGKAVVGDAAGDGTSVAEAVVEGSCNADAAPAAEELGVGITDKAERD